MVVRESRDNHPPTSTTCSLNSPNSLQSKELSRNRIERETYVYDKGELVLIDEKDIQNQKLIPSIRAILPHILNPKDGTVFLKMRYDEKGDMIEHENIISVCAV